MGDDSSKNRCMNNAMCKSKSFQTLEYFPEFWGGSSQKNLKLPEILTSVVQ